MSLSRQILNYFKIKTLKKLKIDKNTSRENILEFIISIPNKFQLCFFDYFHPQVSDPGAYVYVQKVNNKFIFQLANHGWSSYWKEIELESLVDYIYKNKAFTSDCFKVEPIIKYGIIGNQ